MRTRLLCAVIGLILSVPVAAQTPPDGKPALVLNDPFAAPVWRMSADADETHLVTASPAKAAAIWPIGDFAGVELARLPLRDEEMQRAHAIAISPDGKRIAAAVPTLRNELGYAKPGTAVVYVIERGTRRIETQIGEVSTRPQALGFSPDGRFLAATLSDGCGVRVWSTADWTLTGSDDDGYAGPAGTCCPAGGTGDCDPYPDTPGLAWTTGNGTLQLVTSGDTGVRVYTVADGKMARLALTGPDAIAVERPEGVAISPDGNWIAVADARKRGASTSVKLQVAILNLTTLAPRHAPLTLPADAVLTPSLLDTASTPAANQMALNRVAWLSSDAGESIYAGGLTWCQIAAPDRIVGTAETAGTENCLVRWRLPASGDTAAAADVQFVRAGLDRIMDVLALPKHQAVAVASQQRVAVLNEDGAIHVSDAGQEAFAAARAFDFRDRPVDRASGTMLGFDISPDAATVYIEDYRGTAQAPVALTFSVDQLKLTPVAARPPGVASPARDPLLIAPLASWWNGPRPPALYGLPLTALDGLRDTYRSVALAPEKRAVLGSATHVRVVGFATGKAEVLCELRVSAEVYRTAVSADGTVAVAGHSDGTLRWYRIAADAAKPEHCTLSPLLAVHIRQNDEGADWTWAAWQPATGTFAADPRAKELLAWQLTTAGGQVETVRFADVLQLYAPEKIKAALRQLIPPQDTAVASLEKSIGDAVDPLRMMVLSPDENADVDSEVVRVDLKLDGGTTWPRKLYAASGSGARLAKGLRGKDLASNEPVEIAGPGIVQLDVKLPASERQQHRNVDVCFLVDRQRTCQTINWAGALEKPPARTLRAVIVGLSAYKDPSLVLNFAQNDAIDLAKIFVSDYQNRVVDKTSKVPADYASVSIDLLVAATSPAAKAEIGQLEASGVVRVHEATISNITTVLSRLAAEAKNENDLVLFYFSGHGLLNPYRDAKGLTALLGPDIDGSYTRESLERDALTSDRLIALLEPVSGEKLVVIDACRTTAAIAGERAFDPAAVRLEFERNLLTADFFFSAAPGQYSLDQGDLAFSQARPKGEQGNGLFTYALLKSLTDTTDAPSAKPRKVEVYDVDRYVRGFFDGSSPESAATMLIRRLNEQGVSVALQQPVFVPARRRAASATVIRTLEPSGDAR